MGTGCRPPRFGVAQQEQQHGKGNETSNPPPPSFLPFSFSLLFFVPHTPVLLRPWVDEKLLRGREEAQSGAMAIEKMKMIWR